MRCSARLLHSSLYFDLLGVWMKSTVASCFLIDSTASLHQPCHVAGYGPCRDFAVQVKNLYFYVYKVMVSEVNLEPN